MLKIPLTNPDSAHCVVTDVIAGLIKGHLLRPYDHHVVFDGGDDDGADPETVLFMSEDEFSGPGEFFVGRDDAYEDLTPQILAAAGFAADADESSRSAESVSDNTDD